MASQASAQTMPPQQFTNVTPVHHASSMQGKGKQRNHATPKRVQSCFDTTTFKLNALLCQLSLKSVRRFSWFYFLQMYTNYNFVVVLLSNPELDAGTELFAV